MAADGQRTEIHNGSPLARLQDTAFFRRLDDHFETAIVITIALVTVFAGAVAFLEDYLESQDRPVELGLFGVSRGAGAALVASARNPAVKAVVTDGLFSTDVTLESLMRKWANIFAKVRFVYENHPDAFWRFLRWLLFCFAHRKFRCRYPSVRKWMRKMSPRPILMIHGQRDSYISVDQARVLYALAPEPKTLWAVAEARHNQSAVVAPGEYASRTTDFFRRHLAGIEPAPDQIETQPRRVRSVQRS